VIDVASIVRFAARWAPVAVTVKSQSLVMTSPGTTSVLPGVYVVAPPAASSVQAVQDWPAPWVSVSVPDLIDPPETVCVLF